MHDHQEFGRICVPSAAIAIPDAQESQSTVFNLSSFSQALRHMVRIFYGCGLAGCGCASLPVRYHQLNFPPVKELVGEATLEAVAWNRNDSTLGTDAMAYDANFAFVIALMEIRCFFHKTDSSERPGQLSPLRRGSRLCHPPTCVVFDMSDNYFDRVFVA